MKTNKKKTDAPVKESPMSIDGIPMPTGIKTVETSSKHDNSIETRTQQKTATNERDEQ